MSAFIETPAQYERDLRSANKEWKRTKDSSAKWSFGVRPSAGVKLNWAGQPTNASSESQNMKGRPRGKFSDDHGSLPKREHNVVKMRHSASNWHMPSGRVRRKIQANDEIQESSRSISDLLPVSPLSRKMSNMSDNVLYSFDRAESPGKPLSLDVFVKTSSRETERFVEKEYEILDGNGEALKGRKARRHLRQAATDPTTSGSNVAKEVEEDEGFELV